MFLMDTDHLTILERQDSADYSRLISRMSMFPMEEYHASIVSFHEQALGWNAFIQRARTTEQLVMGYERLLEMLDSFATMQVLPFDEDVAQEFDRLRSQRVRIGAMDLRIAATALASGFTLLTRNFVDFSRVPGLYIEDWTRIEDDSEE